MNQNELFTRYKELQEEIQNTNLSHNKRRKKTEEMMRLKKNNKEFDKILDKLHEKDEIVKLYKKEQCVLDGLEHYIDTSIHSICVVLIERGFISQEEDTYILSKSGIIASNIAEVHPIIMTLSILQNNMFYDFNVNQLIGLFACFTNVNVNRDCKREYPHSDDDLLKEAICELNNWMKEYADLENREGIDSGIDYEDALNFDMPDLTIVWTGCENEMQCKSFIQTIGQEKGISIGDFTKAMLKISTIARELSVIAETFGEIALLYKLKQIDTIILKYITTSQSLYV